MKFISCLTLHAVVTHYNEQSFNALLVSNHYLDDHMKYINTLCGQCTEFLNVTLQGFNLYLFRKILKSVYFILSIVTVLCYRLNFPEWFISSA